MMDDNKIKTLQAQNLVDLGFVIQKLGGIIEGKELTEEEEQVMNYCTKVLLQVNKNLRDIKQK